MHEFIYEYKVYIICNIQGHVKLHDSQTDKSYQHLHSLCTNAFYTIKKRKRGEEEEEAWKKKKNKEGLEEANI